MTVRVRIAPSPTGLVHVGNVRAALFNWMFARHHGGVFILRIDDTDRERSEQRYEDEIKEGFRWLGLDWDEGVDVGGDYGPYRQSDRMDRYREVVESLVESGHAYYDDRSTEELENLRQKAQQEKLHPNYYIRRPEREASSGVVRFSVPQDASVEFEDVIRGDVRFGSEVIDDFVIYRSNGTPTYHLASTTDDVDHAITHVIRGEDLLSSTPKHILLTRAIGGTEPRYAHLPLIMGPDGKPLSKRHGPTSLKEFRDRGFLPEAFRNYLSLLGWSIDAERTVFTSEEAIAAFELSDVSKNPAVFDTAKLEWMNGEYIRALPEAEFIERVRPHLVTGLGHDLDETQWAQFTQMAPLIQERTKFFSDAAEQVRFLFSDAVEYDESSWSKVMDKEGVDDVLRVSADKLGALDTFDHDAVETALRSMLEELEIGARKGLQPLRVAITGSQVSPPLFESIAALGRTRTLARLADCRARLS
jgi:glutamyl-tRNA synthetase